jgi:hypothetical protein
MVWQVTDRTELVQLAGMMHSMGLDHTVLYKPEEPFAIAITLVPTELTDEFTELVAEFGKRHKQ